MKRLLHSIARPRCASCPPHVSRRVVIEITVGVDAAMTSARLAFGEMLKIPKTRPLVKGCLSFIIPYFRTTHKRLGTTSALHCYSLFLRHLSLLNRAGVTTGIPTVVAELGPGSSMGTGFAALVAGAEKYYALDLVDHSNRHDNLRIFDEVADLFRNKATIPAFGEFSKIFPDLEDYNFPVFMKKFKVLESRIADIRSDISEGRGKYFAVAAPWTQSSVVKEKSVDWVFSHSVLEHVDNIQETYGYISKILKPSGCTSHLIDFNCHNLTSEWNGHWAIGKRSWTAIRGKRPYLLNRGWCSFHLKLAAADGLIPQFEKRSKRFDGLIREQFEPQFQLMTDEDARTEFLFVVSTFVKLGKIA